jgi:hypothetical protein
MRQRKEIIQLHFDRFWTHVGRALARSARGRSRASANSPTVEFHSIRMSRVTGGQNFRKFSNLSRITEGISECPKKSHKISAEGRKKTNFLGAQRVLLWTPPVDCWRGIESFFGPSGISKTSGRPAIACKRQRDPHKKGEVR